MSTARGTTPTFTLTFAKPDLDLTEAANVYVTFKQLPVKITKTGNDLDIEARQIEVYLSQEETLRFIVGDVKIQANWVNSTGGRGASKVATVYLSEQLLEEILS